MTAYTQELRLPLPEAGDRPCDAAALAAEAGPKIEAALLDLLSIQSRYYPAVPVCVVTTEDTPESTVAGQSTPFPLDAVLVDTDQMVDLARDQFQALISRDGWWLMVGAMTITNPALVEAEYALYSEWTGGDNTVENPGGAGGGSNRFYTRIDDWSTRAYVSTVEPLGVADDFEPPPGPPDPFAFVPDPDEPVERRVGLMMEMSNTTAVATVGVIGCVWLRDLGV